MINIKQITVVEWKGQQGDNMQDVVGLGDDSLMYKWHKGTGTWILWVINK